MQPEAGRRHEHFRGVDADAEIAGQRQVGRAAIDAAIEPADRRHAEILQPVDDDLERRSRARLLVRAGCAVGDRIEVVAGAEGAAGPGQHQHADRGVGLDPVEQRHEMIQVLALQPVQMFWPVEADGGARAGTSSTGALASSDILFSIIPLFVRSAERAVWPGQGARPREFGQAASVPWRRSALSKQPGRARIFAQES